MKVSTGLNPRHEMCHKQGNMQTGKTGMVEDRPDHHTSSNLG